MARHVDPDDHSFRNSLLRAAAGGAVALIVTFAITGVLANVGRGGGEDTPAVTLTAPPPQAQETVAQPPSPDPSPSPEATAAPEPSAASTPQETTETPAGIVTVQVLDAVGSGTHAQDAAQALRDLGYEVVVINSTPRRVKTTTVMFTSGHSDDAETLRQADERFAELKENKDFNPAVDLHILVGPDFTAAD